MPHSFLQKLEIKWIEGKHVCVGLDTDYNELPVWVRYFKSSVRSEPEAIKDFNRSIVQATYGHVGAYKLNTAFYEYYGAQGWEALQDAIEFIRIRAPDVPVILDAKRADIGNTNRKYAAMAFDRLGADAITVHPYLGHEAMKPFLERADRGVIVLCRTSNSGAGEFQDMEVREESLVSTLFRRVAMHVSDPKTWNRYGNCCLVTGATYPDEIRQVREIAPSIPLLIPGIGKQGGDLEKTVAAARRRFLLSASSSIIYASNGRNFAKEALREVVKLQATISQELAEHQLLEAS